MMQIPWLPFFLCILTPLYFTCTSHLRHVTLPFFPLIFYNSLLLTSLILLGILPCSHVFPKSPQSPSISPYPSPTNSLPYLHQLPPYIHTSPSPLSRSGTVGLTQLHAELLQSQARTKSPLSRAETLCGPPLTVLKMKS